jgi:uncharacterized protein (TIGR00661 family)
MRFLFVVQGEGRGHMTQAIALKQILSAKAHEICAVYVGKSQSRSIPRFFIDRMGSPVFSFDSPNFRTDSKRRGVSILGTTLENVRRLPRFARSITTLHKAISDCKPHIIVNFFEPLAAIYGAVRPSRPRMVCIGHQYLLLHPEFPFPQMSRIGRWAMLLFIRICAMGADLRLGLSFRRMPSLPQKRLRVVPPLLRKEVREMTPITEDFILAYVLNDGYANDLAAQQRRIPDVKIHGFWDRRDAEEVTHLQDNLVFHKLNDVAFVDSMRRCKGLMSTAGFESVCEAMYLGKPVYMLPANRQIEQQCNAVDAALSGAGIWGFHFDLARFLDYLPRHDANLAQFRHWVESADRVYIDLFESGLLNPSPSRYASSV